MLVVHWRMCGTDLFNLSRRYSVYLFFLYVRTNVNYIVIGVFVTQSQKKEDIREALEVFKKWNADWNPSHFISDFCEAEIWALEEVFKGKYSNHLISKVHHTCVTFLNFFLVMYSQKS